MNYAGQNGRALGNGSVPVPFPPLGEHLPPQNLEAERSVLGAILLDNDVLKEVSQIVTAADFYRDAHQLVYRAILDIWSQGSPVDTVILADELTRRHQYREIGGDEFLLEITNSVPHTANAVYHAQIVRQKSISRDLIQGATEIIREGYSNIHTAQEVRARAIERLEAVQPGPGEPWPELNLLTEPPSVPFPADVFPVPLRRFCHGVAEVTLSPADLAGAAMLATASAAIGQSVQIRLKRTWTESALLYVLIVADPGRVKSPTLKLVLSPLTVIDFELRESSAAAREAWEEDKRLAPKGSSPEPEPPQRRAVVKDITRETLVKILADNPRGVLAANDEATAWVSSFNEYKGRGSDRQFWLDVWGSSPITLDREGGRRSSRVPFPFVSVLAGIPPDMLTSLVEERGRNDGFLDRILFTFPSQFPRQVWTEDELDEGDELTWHALIRRLHEQQMVWDGERKRLRPNFVGLSMSAKEAWIAFFDEHSRDCESSDFPPDLAGAWSKMRAYAARMALILSRLRLAMDPERTELCRDPVAEGDVLGAIQLVAYFKSNALRTRHRMTRGTGSQEAQAVLGWIQRTRVTQFREAELRRDLRHRFPDPSQLGPAIQALMDAGAIRLKVAGVAAGKRGRKPSRAFEVNPAVREV